MKLSETRSLVTGAGRGLGRAIAISLGRAGSTVVAVARSQLDLDAVVAEIRTGGGTLVGL